LIAGGRRVENVPSVTATAEEPMQPQEWLALAGDLIVEVDSIQHDSRHVCGAEGMDE
jgi:hypothetical protein